MPDLTTATEIAAKARFQVLTEAAKAEGAPVPRWEDLHPMTKALNLEIMLPIITALAEAGLLKEDQ